MTSSIARAGLGVIALGALGGCADDGTGAGGGEPDDATSRPQESSPGGTGGGDEGGGGAGGEAAAAPTRVAVVGIGRMSHLMTDAPALADAALFAEFHAEPPTPSGRQVECDEVILGACTYWRCEVVSPATSDPPPVTFASAGVLTVGGDAMPLTAGPREDSSYEQSWVTDSLLGIDEPWPSDGTVTIDGSGGEVPAFTASVQAPSRYLLDPSTYPVGVVDRSEDLVFRWTALGESDSTVVVDLEARLDGEAWERATCEVPVTDELLVVPRELLARFTPAPHEVANRPWLSMGSVNSARVIAGDWEILVGVSDFPAPLQVAIE